MDRNEEIDLVLRCMAHLRDGSTQMTAEDETVPASRYIDPATFAREHEGVFRRTPAIVAHVSELAEPGAFVSGDLHGTPVLVARDRDGRVQAFVNSCRHRGTRVVAAVCGTADAFVCPYHGWTYRLDGALRAVPSAHGFPRLDRESNGLLPLPTQVRHGFVWCAPQPEGPFALDELLAPVASDLEALGLERLVAYRPVARDWRANWKLVVEGGLEAYHFRVTHARTIAPYFPDNVAIVDELGPHLRAALPRRSLTGLEGTDRESWRLRDHVHVVYNLFPSTALLVQADHVAWFDMRPLAVDRTAITFRMLVPGDLDDDARAHWDRNHEITRTTLFEDWTMAEEIQAGLTGGASPSVRFGRFEGALARYRSLLEARLGHR